MAVESNGITEQRFADAADAAGQLAQDVANLLREGITDRGTASLVVSGGRSPIPFFHALRAQSLDWRKVWITLADERWVDAASADSNEHLVRKHLLVGNAAAARFVGLKTPAATPQAGLAQSAAALVQIPRPFDAVVLGMGDDGHTASLFPGAANLAEALSRVGRSPLAAIEPLTAPLARITLTLPTLLDARRVFLPIAGAAKLAVYARARQHHEPMTLPISAVLHQDRTPVTVLLSDR
ncbi:MAG: 6-phosphogluconolactonase [Panacagrimonas sp.]